MRKLTLTLSIFTIFLTFSLFTEAVAQCALETNRIVNGDAEGNPGATGNVDVVNWENETRGFTVIEYAADESSGFPGPNAPGPPLAERGNYLFFGGNSSATSRGFQTIDLSDCVMEIDAGDLRFDLNGYFGGYLSQNDRAVLNVTFRDVADNVLRTISIGDITDLERENVTGMLFQGRTGLVPVGTRTLLAELVLVRSSGTVNNGYADNLQFVLSSPSTNCPIGTNLLQNGDAEADQTLAGTGGKHEIAGWDDETVFITVARYGGSMTLLPNDPGNFFFYGGEGGTSLATQFLDVSSCASRIDAGIQSFGMNGYFGGFEDQEDSAELNITFLDNTDQTIGTATVGGVTPADRNNMSGMLFRSFSGLIPVGTRTIKADLELRRVGVGNNNGYADNLSFMLTAPTAAAVMVSGRVRSPKGRGISNAVVYLTDTNGNSRTARTNNFGYYVFQDVEVGETYILNAYSKQYQFQTQIVTVGEDLRNLDIWTE